MILADFDCAALARVEHGFGEVFELDAEFLPFAEAGVAKGGDSAVGVAVSARVA